MKTLLVCPFALAMVLSIAGCGEHDHAHDDASSGAAAHSDGHSHAHGHDHGGPKETLGMEVIGGYEVMAVQNGRFRPGAELNFDVEILGEPKPKSVQFWIGTEAGLGSTKADPESEKDNVYHVDIAVPAELPQGSKLWVEMQLPDGSTQRVAFELKS